jgi:hypothetical protein
MVSNMVGPEIMPEVIMGQMGNYSVL